MLIKNTVFLLLMITCNLALLGQKNSSVFLTIHGDIKTDQVAVQFDGGGGPQEILPNFKDSVAMITGAYNSLYPVIDISFPTTINASQYYHRTFFVTDTIAKIFLQLDSVSGEVFCETTNATLFEDEQAAYRAFYNEVENEFYKYYQANIDLIAKNDSIIKEAFAKAGEILMKKTEYVKQSDGSYFDFWVFRRSVAYNDMIPVDSLLDIYETKFPEEFKNSYEGKRVLKIINGRNIKKGQHAIDFEVQDINDRTHRLEDYRGKYLLINFWASWCGACIEEFPAINEIWTEFGDQKLEVLFFTLDNDEEKFQKAAKKHGITWGVHSYASKDLIDSYGAQAIPKLYLIGPNGKFLYNSTEEGDSSDLKILKRILHEKMK